MMVSANAIHHGQAGDPLLILMLQHSFLRKSKRNKRAACVSNIITCTNKQYMLKLCARSRGKALGQGLWEIGTVHTYICCTQNNTIWLLTFPSMRNQGPRYTVALFLVFSSHICRVSLKTPYRLTNLRQKINKMCGRVFGPAIANEFYQLHI